MKPGLTHAAAFCAGITMALGVAKGVQSGWLLEDDASLLTFQAPDGLEVLRDQGVLIQEVPSPVSGLRTWVLQSDDPDSAAQLAISSATSEGYVIGELFSKAGLPLTDDLLGAEARSQLRFTDLAIRSEWLPMSDTDSDTAPLYVMLDVSNAEHQVMWRSLTEATGETRPLRIIPTPFANIDGFESTIDIFTHYHTQSPGQAIEITSAYLSSDRSVPEEQKKNAHPHPMAVSSMSRNSNLHHRLRLQEAPVVLQESSNGTTEVIALSTYLTNLGQSSTY